MTERDLIDICAWEARGLLRHGRPTLRQAAIRAAMSLRWDVGHVRGMTVEALASAVLERLRASELATPKQRRAG